MRSIANGQLDGFPPKDELRTVYVEHDIDASESNVPVVEYVYSDPILQDASHPAHTQVSDVLGSVGFTEAMQQAPVSSLSGGWKMKLALGETFVSFFSSVVIGLMYMAHACMVAITNVHMSAKAKPLPCERALALALGEIFYLAAPLFVSVSPISAVLFQLVSTFWSFVCECSLYHSSLPM